MSTQTQIVPSDRGGRSREAPNRSSAAQYRTAPAAREMSNPQRATVLSLPVMTPPGGWEAYNRAVLLRLITNAINEANASGFVPPRACGSLV